MIRSRTLAAIGLGFLALGVAGGCGGHGSPALPPLPPSSDAYELTATTRLITATSPLQVVSRTGKTLILNEPDAVKPGDTLMSEVGEGMLVKATRVQSTGGRTTVTTEPASLTDAFARLDPNAGTSLTEEIAGPIASSDSTVRTEWVPSVNGAVKDTIRVTFGADGAPTRANGSTGLTGTLDFVPTLVWNPVVRSDANGGSEIESVEVGVGLKARGSIKLVRTYSGSFSLGKAEYVSRDLKSFTIPGTLIRVTPHLTIRSRGEGSANFGISAGVDCTSDVALGMKWANGEWTPSERHDFTAAPYIAAAKGTFDYDFAPIEVLLDFKVFGIAGPELGVNVGAKGTGVLAVDATGADVVRAHLQSGLFGSVGIRGDEGIVALLDEVFRGKVPTVSKSFQLAGPEFEKEFRISAGDIEVGDNGPAPDDVFSVSVDGKDLGQTTRGGTGRFPISDLAPGSHTLRIGCLDDGGNGADAGTLGVALRNGVTFGDGSTTYSADLALGQSISLTIVVPETRARTEDSMPFPRILDGRRGG